MGYIQLIFFAALAALAFAGKHAYDNGKRAEGRAEMLPTIQRGIDQLKADTEAFKQIETSMLEIKANSAKLKKQVEFAQKLNANRNAQEKTRVEYIDRIVPSGNTECERTTDAIKKGLR